MTAYAQLIPIVVDLNEPVGIHPPKNSYSIGRVFSIPLDLFHWLGAKVFHEYGLVNNNPFHFNEISHPFRATRRG